MKRLISQQRDIRINYESSENKTESDFKKAINQHLKYLSSRRVLIPFASKEKRDTCKDFCTVTDFDSIDGAFCKNCGFIFPF